MQLAHGRTPVKPSLANEPPAAEPEFIGSTIKGTSGDVLNATIPAIERGLKRGKHGALRASLVGDMVAMGGSKPGLAIRICAYDCSRIFLAGAASRK